MRIVFWGIPDLGLMCFNSLIEKTKSIITVVPPVPGHFGHNIMINAAQQHNIPVLFFNESPKEQDFVEKFRELKPDLAVVCACDHKIPKELLEIPKMGFINCHPSLLPDYRGGNPYFHVIFNGEKKTGVSIHYMDEDFDSGDIITQWETDLMPNETLGTLLYRLNVQTASMIADLVEKIENGNLPERIPQSKKENICSAPIIYPDNGDTFIDWTKEAVEIERFVRACNPIFGACATFRGCVIKIWSGICTNDTNASTHKPGSIVFISENDIAIATGKGFFLPKTFQLANLLITDAGDFIKRTNPKVGESF